MADAVPKQTTYADDRDAPERINAIVDRLQREADKRVGQRELIERRWLEDYRQYHGKYEDDVRTDLQRANRSTLFINQTRPKTNAMAARLSDMLFPTDDRNWGIKPTPVPELVAAAQAAADQARGLAAQAAVAPAGAQQADLMAQAMQRQEAANALQAEMEEARKRASAMQDEIDDQLKSCNYETQARDVIMNASKLGTGVMKGPVIEGRVRKRWQRQLVQDRDGETQTVYEMADRADNRPAYWRVDPWSFFPDLDARTLDETESVMERHLMNKKQLRKLARQPGFDKDAIRRVLRNNPRSSAPQYIQDLRTLTGALHDSGINRYHVWEYHGPISAEELRDMALALGDEGATEDIEDTDPLDEIQASVWFCDGQLLKFGIHPLDSGEHIYSVFNLETDDASVFGLGVPAIMRDPQKAMNAGWRMMLDNSGLTTGPQVVINTSAVEPADGDWRLAPLKVWKRNAGGVPNERAFEVHNIDGHQAELANIIGLARQFIDEESSMPMLAQGEKGATPEQTASGMAMLMNATNVIFRRIVKNFDDDMTTPNIRRLYDWNMQFSNKEHIKGDFEVDARGTSVLLVREIQSQNLMIMALQMSAHPVLGPMTKVPALYRRLVQSLMLPADEIVMTDEELKQAAANQPPQPNAEMEKIAAQMNLAKIERQTKLDLAVIERETAMMSLAAQQNMTVDELRAKLQLKEIETQSKERIFAGEAAMEARLAAQGKANGSGGYISA